ncbi:HD domain-containing protein [Mycolicibacterium iranicum]|uniref:Uncharacterized protein n=1 Tax=Mycolicibacterium iranicum TaxID=912594 RepID=A0A1X1WYP8_MYCIR|nr:HD domain-containing protein [Mycolicibacterium iranicum]ORV91734.1 hypothetical protein AWC12_03460 [Mycolicibacterium iranicum]
MRVAQTNLQLLTQLNKAGSSDDDIRMVGRAYNTAARAYAGKIRATGKPLIAHVVGTSSLLLHAGCSAETMAAALLHAPPGGGEYGLRRWKPIVAKSVGLDVADLVDAYCALRWTFTNDQIEHLMAKLDRLTDAEREALKVRLANEIEDYMDDATAHYGLIDEPGLYKSAAFRRQYILDTASNLAALATKLDVPFLADRIEDTRNSLSAELVAPVWPRLNENTVAMFSSGSYLQRIRDKGAIGTVQAIFKRIRR